jgi:Fic family protein
MIDCDCQRTENRAVVSPHRSPPDAGSEVQDQLHDEVAMIKLEMKTSPRLVQQIGTIERFAGIWDRLSQSEAVASDTLFQRSLQEGAEACFRLDSTSPTGLALFIEIEHAPHPVSSTFSALTAKTDHTFSGKTHSPLSIIRNTSPSIPANQLKNLIDAHTVAAEFDIEGLVQLYQLINPAASEHFEETNSDKLYREITGCFVAPGSGIRADEVVFPTLPAFLIEQRLQDLLEWTRHELEEGNFHPLFIIGIFHLLFLQIHPFTSANHRLALVLLWRLLEAHGYGFVRYSHFAPEMEGRSRQYFSALRQAEKTASGNWSTLNIWLELFLDTLILASNRLMDTSERNVSSARLTSVQRKIIEVIKSNGSATREKIVTETGINLSTVKYNLSVLASRGHLKRDGGGRTTSYRLL